MFTAEPYNMEYKDILHLVELMLAIPISSAECERVISAQNRIKTNSRSSLSASILSHLIRISKHGPSIEQYDPLPAIQKWLTSGQRPRNCKYTEDP